MSLIRSVIHALWVLIILVPWAIVMMVSSLWSSGTQMWWMAARWLRWVIAGARVILGIQVRVTGFENLPVGEKSPAVLLVKHQSTLETFLIPALMPHPLAFVFKR